MKKLFKKRVNFRCSFRWKTNSSFLVLLSQIRDVDTFRQWDPSKIGTRFASQSVLHSFYETTRFQDVVTLVFVFYNTTSNKVTQGISMFRLFR